MTLRAGLWFVDSNVLLYNLDSANTVKQRSAQLWLDKLWEHGCGCLSWQVLNEFYANGTGKIGAPAAVLRKAVETYVGWGPAEFSMGLMQNAWLWVDHAGLNYWDALILAAAERMGCRWLLTEDFQESRKYGSVEVVNPFRTPPEEFFRQPPR